MTATTPPTHDTDPLPAYLLAGGRSLRFGSDKARAVVDGQSLIVHVAQTLQTIATAVTVVAREADQYADLGLDTIPDNAADNGPVQGLFTALIHRAQRVGEGWLLLAACDMLPPDAAPYRELCDAMQHRPAPSGAVVFFTDRWHPMPGLYHTTILPAVAAYLADGGRAFQELLARKPIAAFAPHTQTDPLAKLVHANTPEQLRDGLTDCDSEPQDT